MTAKRKGPSGNLSRRGLVASALALGASASVSTGCGFLSKELNRPPPGLHWLGAAKEFAPGLPQASWQLLVKPVTATMGLDTVKVAKRTHSPYLIDYVEGAVWSERAPRMIQMLVIESFENSGQILAVGHEDTGLHADMILQLDLRDFTINVNSPETGNVAVVVGARLIDLEEAHVIGSRKFEYREYYAGTGFHNITHAYANASEAFFRDLVAWTLTTGDNHLHGNGTDSLQAAPPVENPEAAGG